MARNVPSTNNAQEATHKAIKDRQTLRNRFDIGKFREVLFQMVKNYSLEYSNGIREYHHKPLIDLPVWTDAYNWAKTNQNIDISNHRDCVKHVISLKTIDSDEIDESLQWESFNNFRKMYFSKCTFRFRSIVRRGRKDTAIVRSSSRSEECTNWQQTKTRSSGSGETGFFNSVER